jgi:intein/homing endonuclease
MKISKLIEELQKIQDTTEDENLLVFAGAREQWDEVTDIEYDYTDGTVCLILDTTI